MFLSDAALSQCRQMSFNDISFIRIKISNFDEENLEKERSTLHLDFTDIEKENLLKLSFDEMWKQILQTN